MPPFGSNVQFVIRSSPRTGSHMLATALDSHENLCVTGEALLRPEIYGIKPCRSLPDLLDRIFRRFHGFIQHRRLDFPQAPWSAPGEDACGAAWRAIVARDQVKIVSLRRRDLLAMVVSLELAKRTNVWQVARSTVRSAIVDHDRDGWCAAEGACPSAPPIHLDPRELAGTFRQTECEYAELDGKLAGDRVLRVDYEDLVEHGEAELRRVQAFLGVPCQTLAPATRKQQNRPLAETIENYDELRRYFAGTRFGHLFGGGGRCLQES